MCCSSVPITFHSSLSISFFYLPLSLFQGLQGIRAAQPRWTRTLTVATRMPAVAISAARTWASLSWGCSTRSLVLAPAPCWGMPGLRAKLQPRYWQRLHVEHIVVVKQRIIVWRALCNMLVEPPPPPDVFNLSEIFWLQSSQHMIYFNFILIKAFSHPLVPYGGSVILFLYSSYSHRVFGLVIFVRQHCGNDFWLMSGLNLTTVWQWSKKKKNSFAVNFVVLQNRSKYISKACDQDWSKLKVADNCVFHV